MRHSTSIRYIVMCANTDKPIHTVIADSYEVIGGKYRFFRSHGRVRKKDVVEGTSKGLEVAGEYPYSSCTWLDFVPVDGHEVDGRKPRTRRTRKEKLEDAALAQLS